MSNKKQHFQKTEKTFTNQKELQNYFVDSLSKIKRLNFNLTKVTLLK